MDKIKITVSEPTNKPLKLILTKEDVFGEYNIDTHKRLSNGMIVARQDEICPIWGDKIPYKAETVICLKDLQDEVIYWLEYVNGAYCVLNSCSLPNNRIAIRSQYQCW